jgi:lipoprotein signal peptidase
VIDFINIHILPIFNAADICVCCGCALLVLSVLFLEPRFEKAPEKPDERRSDS